MNTYLRLRCGEFPLLMPADAVIEIAANPGVQGGGVQGGGVQRSGAGDSGAGDSGGRRAWRDRSLPLIDLPARLGCTDGRRAEQVVIGEGGEATAIVVVDHVEGISELADGDFIDIAAVTHAQDGLLAGVCIDARGQCLLRLRLPFTWLDDDSAASAAGRPS